MKTTTKIEFTFKNYSDAFHAVRVLSQTKIVFKASSNEKIKQDRMHSEASSVSNYEIYYENLKK